MPAQLLFRAEQPVGRRVLELLPPLFYGAELGRIWRQELQEDVMFPAVVADFLCLVPLGVIHYEKQSLVFGTETFEELEELFGVDFVSKHVVAFVVSLRAVAVEVRSDVRELLRWFCPARIPAVCDFWLDAERGFIQNKQRVALCYESGNQARKLFLKRFCAALFAL